MPLMRNSVLQVEVELPLPLFEFPSQRAAAPLRAPRPLLYRVTVYHPTV